MDRPWPLAAKVALRLALCGGVTWLAYRQMGLGGAVGTVPLYGIALAGPLYESFAAAHHLTKEMHLRGVQGRHFHHRGHAIDIVEDDDDEARWLLVRDIRKVLPSLPRDPVLERMFPERARAWPPDGLLRMRADAVVELLKQAREPAGVKFKVWVEREVMLGKA